jgi:hypothetical protein
VVVSPISWQRNLNLCGWPRSSSEPWTLISVCTRPGQHVTERIGPYQPQVPRAELGLGVRWRLALTSIGVPGPSLGNSLVVGFSLGLGCVPGESPVAGQLSGTPCRARTHTHNTHTHTHTHTQTHAHTHTHTHTHSGSKTGLPRKYSEGAVSRLVRRPVHASLYTLCMYVCPYVYVTARS